MMDVRVYCSERGSSTLSFLTLPGKIRDPHSTCIETSPAIEVHDGLHMLHHRIDDPKLDDVARAVVEQVN